MAVNHYNSAEKIGSSRGDSDGLLWLVIPALVIAAIVKTIYWLTDLFSNWESLPAPHTGEGRYSEKLN